MSAGAIVKSCEEPVTYRLFNVTPSMIQDVLIEFCIIGRNAHARLIRNFGAYFGNFQSRNYFVFVNQPLFT